MMQMIPRESHFLSLNQSITHWFSGSMNEPIASREKRRVYVLIYTVEIRILHNIWIYKSSARLRESAFTLAFGTR